MSKSDPWASQVQIPSKFSNPFLEESVHFHSPRAFQGYKRSTHTHAQGLPAATRFDLHGSPWATKDCGKETWVVVQKQIKKTVPFHLASLTTLLQVTENLTKTGLSKTGN